MNLQDQELQELFKLADRIGKKGYHKLTQKDFEDYKRYNDWRYINSNFDCGTTQESKKWVNDNSERECPICAQNYHQRFGKTIDHKLPRSQYPWLSMDFKNFWVICQLCNEEKGDMHWYEYEHYMFTKHPDLYPNVRSMRPTQLLKSLKE
jgi:5-methylcytosine-specific restriction endonuclease McrA